MENVKSCCWKMQQNAVEENSSFKRGNILGVDLSNSNISFEKLKQFKSKFLVTRLQRPQRIDLNTGQCC